MCNVDTTTSVDHLDNYAQLFEVPKWFAVCMQWAPATLSDYTAFQWCSTNISHNQQKVYRSEFSTTEA